MAWTVKPEIAARISARAVDWEWIGSCERFKLGREAVIRLHAKMVVLPKKDQSSFGFT
jgi:hypothetical protein